MSGETYPCPVDVFDGNDGKPKGQTTHHFVNTFRSHRIDCEQPHLKCTNCGTENSCTRCTTINGEECRICGMFVRIMEKHLRVHTGERPYSCDYCGQKFKHLPPLQYHHRIHRKEWPFPCEFCGQKFRSRGNLKEHQAHIHSTERNFPCKQCSKSYKWSNNLMQHYRKKHACAYNCSDCGERLRTRNSFTNHHAKHVKDKATTDSCLCCEDEDDDDGCDCGKW